jgi:hypothetical protein
MATIIRAVDHKQQHICLTTDESFQAGWEAPCEHGVPDPNRCPRCRLTDEEIRRLAVLHRPYLAPLLRREITPDAPAAG